MKLTPHIVRASDGWLELEVDELPELHAHVRSVNDIPDAVGTAAAALTGKPRQELTLRSGAEAPSTGSLRTQLT